MCFLNGLIRTKSLVLMLSFLKIFLVFAKTGAFTTGGSYAMQSLIQTQVVIEQGWLTGLLIY